MWNQADDLYNHHIASGLRSNHLITSGVTFGRCAVDGADMYLTSTDEVLNKGK